MSKFHLKITHHTKKQKNIQLSFKSLSVNAKTATIDMLDSSDKDFKAAVMKTISTSNYKPN